MAPIAVLCGGLGVALFAGTRVPRTDVKPSAAESSAVTGQAKPVEVAEKPLTAEYRPSRFPGVMVRALPDARVAEPKQARWYVRNGGKRQIAPGSIYNPPSAGQVTRTKLPSGGVRRNLPASYKLAEGVVLKNGRLVPFHMPAQVGKGRSAR